MSFNEQLDQHSQWRREFALRLQLLVQWLKDHDLLDSSLEERLQRLHSQLRSDKIMVAFVAEFSRGKSELINALFFADYGRRIMPATAGRTTMCPTELGYDPELPPCLRLLPIETRLHPQTLMEWRIKTDRWERIDLDVDNPQQLASAFGKVSETKRVTQQEAQALGLWNPTAGDENPAPDALGMVEVPRWRHALINVAHPLLKQGLVILDTPGLNAIGTEPELTVSLIPQTQAVVFLLGADTGVTKSDLAIWREHLVPDSSQTSARLVVLNKIDAMWDSLSTPDEVQAQITRQCNSVAQTLEVPADRVLAVSAQKGLLAKVNRSESLLARSGLRQLETKLGTELLQNRQTVLRAALARTVKELLQETHRVIRSRQIDITEQEQELLGLQGKNTNVIRHMRGRVVQEQAEFELGTAKIQALRSVQLKQVREIVNLLNTQTLKKEMFELTQSLHQRGLKLGIQRVYEETFVRLRAKFGQVRSLCDEMHAMLEASFKQLNVEFGFALQVPDAPDMVSFEAEIEAVKRAHLHYLGIGNAIKLAQVEFAERLVRALRSRLNAIHDAAMVEVELWSKAAASQIDIQNRERRRSYTRRLEAIDRIQGAANTLQDRIAELHRQQEGITQLTAKLTELTNYLLQPTRA